MTQLTRHKMLRCYAELKDGQWQAFCIDLTLAAQGDSLEEVKEKLHRHIVSYIKEANTIDAEYADELLNRQAPLAWRMKFHAYNFYCKFSALRAAASARARKKAFGQHQVFKEPMPSFAP